MNPLKIYSTGDVAKVCGVAPKTVARWADEGLLKSYRIPGTGGHRRFIERDLVAFMESNGMGCLVERIGEVKETKCLPNLP